MGVMISKTSYLLVYNGYVAVIIESGKYMAVKVNPLHHFIFITPKLQFLFKIITMKPGTVPLFTCNSVPFTVSFFPKTPGAVVLLLVAAVQKQNGFIVQLSCLYHFINGHEGRKSASGKNVMVMFHK